MDSGSSDDESSFAEVGSVGELAYEDGLTTMSDMAKFISEWPS
jgi:hypothetical protein